MNYIERYTGFRKELAVAETFDEIKLIEHKAKAAAEFAKKSGIGKREQDEWGEFRVEIEAKKGQWLKQNFPHGVNKEFRRCNERTSSMQDYGINKHESSDARLVHDEEKLRVEVIGEIKEDKEVIVTPREVSKRIRDKIKNKEKADRKEREEKTPKFEIDTIELIHGDFNDFNPGEIDLILTDPPYPEKFLPEWEKLALWANKYLKPSGFLVTYSGHIYLDRVMESLALGGLIYYWCGALWHKGGSTRLVAARNIIAEWKPILIYQKPPFSKLKNTLVDFFDSDRREKNLHPWQQGIKTFEILIDKFTELGELVCDPFLGSGTTALAAYNKKRFFKGCDIDADCINITKGRLLDAAAG